MSIENLSDFLIRGGCKWFYRDDRVHLDNWIIDIILDLTPEREEALINSDWTTTCQIEELTITNPKSFLLLIWGEILINTNWWMGKKKKTYVRS